MTHSCDPPDDLRSFGRCAAGQSIVMRPQCVQDVLDAFAIARKEGRTVTIRAGGHSFHDQAVHDGDTGQQIILTTENFQQIQYNPGGKPNRVKLGAGYRWGNFLQQAIERARKSNQPIQIPGSMQTARCATAGGTLSGDCLSRFSGTMGKESNWIESFSIVTPSGKSMTDVTERSDPDLFHAVVGGHGFIGFVTDATYKLVSIGSSKVCARTKITRHTSLHDAIQKQLDLVAQGQGNPAPRAISAAWFTDLLTDTRVQVAVFDSVYAEPSKPSPPAYPLYSDIDSAIRKAIELMVRFDGPNFLVHEFLYAFALENCGVFENDLTDFVFFMDGNTTAKLEFERLNYPQQFPIVQQTYVVPANQAEAFTQICMDTFRANHIRPTESDMLYCEADDCFLSATYKQPGFAVSFGFEPIAPKGCPKQILIDLLTELSVVCKNLGGRIHPVKNVYVDRAVFQAMLDPQIKKFEQIKELYDPAPPLLRNTFWDRLF